MHILPVAATQFTSFLPLLSVLLQAVPVSSAEVNYTIDDQLGDSVTGALPAYLPLNLTLDKWQQGNQCTGCGIHPGAGGVDVSQPFDGTWHDSTYHPGQSEPRIVSVSFTGTAVYVFNLVPNTVLSPVTTFTNLSFFIDNDYVGQYIHEPDNTSIILYRVPVYTNTSLSSGEHSLIMMASGSNASIILFDFIRYTNDDGADPSSSNPSSTLPNTVSSAALFPPSPSSSGTSPQSLSSSRKSSTPVGAIVGGTVGGVCALIIVAAVCLRLRRSPSLQDSVGLFVAKPTAEISPGQPVTHWPSRAPMPSPKLGRLNPAGGVDSSTPASFNPHRPHLLSLSVPGTHHSQLPTELVQRIQALEAQMRAMDVEQGQLSSSVFRSVSSSGLRSNISGLQHEISELRAEFEENQRLLTEGAPPCYVE